MKQTGLFFILLLSVTQLMGQLSDGAYFQGYTEETQGFTLSYHSPMPDISQSLLVRSNKDYSSIEWATETLPNEIEEDMVSFVWMYGVDTDVDTHTYKVLLNGQQILQFSNPKQNDQDEWSVQGKGSSTLLFRTTLVDKYKDQMGIAVLTVPKKMVNFGQKQQIRIEGDNSGANTWFMVFKTGIKEEIQISQDDVVVKRKKQKFHQARINITWLGKVTEANVQIGQDYSERITLKTGHNTIYAQMPKVSKPSRYKAEIRIGEKKFEKGFLLQPVKEWTVYLVQHSHTDIGYTRPQTEILPEHLRYIDYALDFCDLTDDYPEHAKFRWTCESSWAVREFLKSRPEEQIDRFRKRVNEGRIELTAMFFNMSEILDEYGLVAQTQAVKGFREAGFKVETAMQNDVNGIGWGLADYFPDAGINYLIMGEHGHRALIPFDKPTAFWWESPSGKRVLAYRGEHYMKGNKLGVHMGNVEYFGTNLLNYLSNLDDLKYPFDMASLQYSGYVTDNSPPSTFACDLVKEWNEYYEWPKLKIATASKFLKEIEKNHLEELEVHRAAWPDWWVDGFGSSMRETATARMVHSDMIATQGLLSMAVLNGAKLPYETTKEISDIDDHILFYDEHTWGAAESVRQPWCENTMVQWAEKSAYVWEAVKTSRMLREKGMGFMQPYLAKTDVPSIVVFNSLNQKRSGLVEVYIDHEILPNHKAFRFLDNDGNEISGQSLKSREDGTYWGIWVEDVPAFGYKSYRIEVLEETRNLPQKKSFEGSFANDFYSVSIDPDKGAISSLVDKELNIDLVDQQAEWMLGEFIYEQLSNRTQLEHFRLDSVKRTTLQEVRIRGVVEGPVWNSLLINGKHELCANEQGVNLEIRLYNKEKRIEFLFDMIKLPVIDPEAVYVAFPFALNNGEIFFEGQGGLIKPGKDQLAGTSSDWNTIQNYAVVKNDKAQIVFGSQEVPLAHFGDLNIGKFQYVSNPENPHIYSWVLNNYWVTNFKASQEGELKWKYYLTSMGNNSNAHAAGFGWGSRIPFLTRVLPHTNIRSEQKDRNLLDLDNENLLLVSARTAKDNSGIILHLRELNGKETLLNIDRLRENSESKNISLVNVLEEIIIELEEDLKFKPKEVKFIKLRL